MRKSPKDEKREKPPASKEITRRTFLTTAGVGGVGVAAVGGLAGTTWAGRPARLDVPAAEASGLTQATLTVNGRTHRLLVEPRWSLAFVLRERLGLTGTKASCERGECGSCTVLIDGKPRYACMTLCLEAEDCEITTVEGLMKGEELGEVQQAFLENDAFQCGHCAPGQIVAVEGLLRASPDPSFEEIRSGVSGNLCRCGSYTNIFAAARRAAELKRGGGA